MKAAIVYKISIWEIYKDSPDEETRAYLERGGKNLETLQRSSEIQKATLQNTLDALDAVGIEHQRIYLAGDGGQCKVGFPMHETSDSVDDCGQVGRDFECGIGSRVGGCGPHGGLCGKQARGRRVDKIRRR